MGEMGGGREEAFLRLVRKEGIGPPSSRMGGGALVRSVSACVYAADKQTTTENPGLKEADAYPAMPEDGYGWEKLFSERMCRHFREDFKLETRYNDE